ncbi:MAG: YggS family pyridoxal phosphate-dependent enzyme [Alphaproteobacteria bacterium]|nr:YggS family pyridoxal phosphate-dependent enzyme [Alphaproteobacteria bacterium]
MYENEKILNKIKILDNFLKNYPDARLLIVTKGQNVETINFLINNEINAFGENKIQEIKNKFKNLKNKSIHFIGRIQTNKIDDIVTHCIVIHSLDRVDVAKKFSDIEKKFNIQRDYFIQMNLAKEAQKGGIFEEDLEKFLIETKENLKLNVKGLMLIPPQDEDPTPYFRRLKLLTDMYGLKERSMGMSHDYKIALNEGATIIRIGSYIFNDDKST